MLLLIVNILYIIIIFKYDLLNNKDKLYSVLLFSIFLQIRDTPYPKIIDVHPYSILIRVSPPLIRFPHPPDKFPRSP